jgi:hypothetical protein
VQVAELKPNVVIKEFQLLIVPIKFYGPDAVRRTAGSKMMRVCFHLNEFQEIFLQR